MTEQIGSNRNASDLHCGNARFASRLRHSDNPDRFFVVLLHPHGKSRDKVLN